MIQYAFSFLLLIISTIIYCMYKYSSSYDDRRSEIIREKGIREKVDALSYDEKKAIVIKQAWKDCDQVSPFNNTEWIFGYYFFTVLITVATIVTCSIMDYKKDHSVLGLIYSIGKPIATTVIIWIISLVIMKKDKGIHIDSIKNLETSLESSPVDYYSSETYISAIAKDKNTTKEKVNRYYSAVGIILLISAITLTTSFFNKSEYEIEEEQEKIEESYQRGYEDGYADGVGDQ